MWRGFLAVSHGLLSLSGVLIVLLSAGLSLEETCSPPMRGGGGLDRWNIANMFQNHTLLQLQTHTDSHTLTAARTLTFSWRAGRLKGD